MSKEPVVSIITPCYNGEKCIHRFLDSILAQTCSFIELIIINDGSTDNTERIILSYKKRFKSRGIKLVYIFQENQGVGGAVNTGLKRVTGEYLCWPDYDDYLEPESVELRLQTLEKLPEYAIITSDAYLRSSENLEVPLGLVSAGHNTIIDSNQFYHLLNGRTFICSGCYMVRTKVFFETHPSGEIFPSRSGQNYQMLLPVYYQHKSYFLNKPLYNYVKSDISHSRLRYIGFNEKINTYNHHREIFLETLSAMNMVAQEKIYCMKIVNVRFSNLIFNTAYSNGDYELLLKEYTILESLNQISIKLRLRFSIARLKQVFLSYFSKQNID